MAGSLQLSELPQTVQGLIEARTGDAVFVVAPDYSIVYWDEQAHFITGFTAEEMVGKCCYEAILGEREGGEPFCCYGCPVMRLARAGRPVASYDMCVRGPSGGQRWVSVSVLSVDSAGGPYLIHLLRDSQKSHETLEMAQSLISLSKKPCENEPSPTSTNVPALTARQLEILGLLSEGNSAREISKRLYLSEATVRNHIRSLLQALGAHSQLDALARAREAGLLSG